MRVWARACVRGTARGISVSRKIVERYAVLCTASFLVRAGADWLGPSPPVHRFQCDRETHMVLCSPVDE